MFGDLDCVAQVCQHQLSFLCSLAVVFLYCLKFDRASGSLLHLAFLYIMCFRRHFRRCSLEIHGKFCRLDVYKVLDLFYNNKPTLVKAMVNVPGVSDHDAIVADCDIKPAFCKKKPRTVFLFSKANWSPSQNALLRLSLP